jgi:hypothetical protein
LGRRLSEPGQRGIAATSPGAPEDRSAPVCHGHLGDADDRNLPAICRDFVSR